jgi:guanylate kinase
LEVAAACMQSNTQERLKPVLEAFGILGDSSQQELNFEDETDEPEEESDDD